MTDTTQPSARLRDAEIEQYRELSEQATAGPWEIAENGHRNSLRSPDATRQQYRDGSKSKLLTCWGNHHYDDSEYLDAAFIAASRTIGPQLAEEVLRLREEIQMLLEFWPYDMKPDSPYWRLFALIRDDEQEARS